MWVEMITPGSIAGPTQLSESRKRALLALLGDEDPVVFEAVRSQLLLHGQEVVEWLEPHVLSPDPLLRRRAKEIIAHFSRQTADIQFLQFCLKQGEDLDLETGAWLLATTQFPEICVDGYRAVLDDFTAELRDRRIVTGDAEEVLEGINDHLFGTLNFRGNEENYYDPDNSYLNRVVDRRTGNPIALSILYIVIARRLRLPVAGIGLPGHFICRFQSSLAELYIDPFNRGRLLTKADCLQYLMQGTLGLRDDDLSPVSSRRMLLRVCGNLHQIYARQKQLEQVTRLQRYIVALAR